jgi:hypothetical protein
MTTEEVIAQIWDTIGDMERDPYNILLEICVLLNEIEVQIQIEKGEE